MIGSEKNCNLRFKGGRVMVKRLLLVCLALSLAGMTFAQVDELAEGPSDAPGPIPITTAVPNIEGLLIIGTASNVNDPSGTANMVYTVNPADDTSAAVLAAVQWWGATADVANSRVLFTRASGLTPPSGMIGGGDDLYEIPFAGGDPVLLGRITDAAGDGFRVDGLAVSGGVLYGANAGGGTQNGLYTIDWGTLQVTVAGTYSNSISGIDADPDTGTIYGVNDSTGQLVTLSSTGTITPVTGYPAGLSDIDGIACGGGNCYLVEDEPGNIEVYSIAGGSYGAPLTNPFTSADTFSAAAIAAGGGGGDDGGGDVPATTGIGIALLVVLLGGGGAYFLRRK
jgi:hypothetical protein